MAALSEVAAKLGRGVWLLGLIALLCGTAHSEEPAAPGSQLEYQVKAAFLYNFAKFIEWPEESGAVLHLCVHGEDPFGPALEDTLNGKLVRGRRIEIHRLVPANKLRECHIAFIAESERRNAARLLPSLRDAAVLSVSDFPGFAQLGGVVNFTVENDRVRFEINVDAAARVGLRISSRLLALATVVREPAPGKPR